MLKGIDPLLTPELLKQLAEMGHGDEIVLADANFTAYSLAGDRPVIPLAGAGMLRALEAVMSLFPLDAYVAQPIAFMHVGGEAPDYLSALQREAVALLGAKGWATPAQFEPMERFAFYDRAKKARAVVHTGELQPYANFILKKGVIAEPLAR